MYGHYLEVNGHKIYGYCRYFNLYKGVAEFFPSGSHFVEVGSFLGQSTAAMAAFIAQVNKNIKFDAIDLFELSEFSDEEHFEVLKEFNNDLFGAFKDNLKLAGVEKYVNILKMASKDAAKLYENESLDFVMIDASHEYEDVKEDINCWLPKVKVGGILAGDDLLDGKQEVAYAVRDTIGLENIKVDNSTWVYIKN